MVTISKQYTFDAAHRLPNHNGKCSRLHGHTYRVTVYAAGRIRVDDPSASDYGMVIDYGEIDAIVKPLLESLDHHMLNEAPVDDESNLLSTPTAERIALFILRKLYNAYSKKGGRELAWKVRVDETPNTSVSVDIYDSFNYDADSRELPYD